MYEPYHSFNWGYEMVRLIQAKYGVEWKHIGSDKFLEIFKSSESGDASFPITKKETWVWTRWISQNASGWRGC